jgi:phosphatidylserine/phosphatidylglycerophosphate/cardiolipin synthase-like enzyme
MPRRLERLLLATCLATSAQAFDSTHELPATGTLQFAFSPDGGAARLIIDAIDEARTQVLVQAYIFTHQDIARALISAHRRGLDVQVIADAEQATRAEHHVLNSLKREGIAVWLDAQHSAAHNKIMLIDVAGKDAVLISGSFNFTYAAEHLNAENLLIFRGNAPLARTFADNWHAHRAHAAAFAMH